MTKCTNQNNSLCASIQMCTDSEFFCQNLLTNAPEWCIINTEVEGKARSPDIKSEVDIMSNNFFKCDVIVNGSYFDTVILSGDYSEIDYIVEHVKNRAFDRSDRVEFELSDAVEDRFEITSERSLEICNLSDEDLCREINASSEWDYDLLRDLAWRETITSLSNGRTYGCFIRNLWR